MITESYVSAPSNPPSPLSPPAVSSCRPSSRNRLPLGHPKSSIRRRPDSVFSRRGVETPVALVEPVNLRDTTSAPETAPRSQPKMWKIVKGQPKTTEQKGTELRAVPQSTDPASSSGPSTTGPRSPPFHQPRIERTSHEAFDAAMATSPNDEILRKISRSSSYPSSQRSFSTAFSVPTISPAGSPKTSRKETSKIPQPPDVIGVWKNGRVYWETDQNSVNVKHAGYAGGASTELDSMPIILQHPSYTGSPQNLDVSLQRERKPKIQVIIPGDQRNRSFVTRLQFPPTSSQAVRVANDAPFAQEVSPPSATNGKQARSSIVSPLANQIPQARRQLTQTTVPVYLEGVPEQAFEDSPTLPIESSWASVSASSSPIILIQKTHNSVSSNSNQSTDIDDDASNYSRSARTSMTSVESAGRASLPKPTPFFLDGRTARAAFSIASPTTAGIFDSPHVTESLPSSPEERQASKVELNKPLPPEPKNIAALPVRVTTPCSHLRSRSSTPSSPSLKGSIEIPRKSSKRNPRSYMATLPPKETGERSEPHVSTPPSPTLSEAADDLDQLLNRITDDTPSRLRDHSSSSPPTPNRHQSESDLHSFSLPESKRQVSLPVSSEYYRVPMRHIAAQQVRPHSAIASASLTHGQKSVRFQRQQLSLIIPNTDQKKYEEIATSSSWTVTPVERQIEPSAAEQVIRKIFESFESLDDLFATALVNKGFFRVFKRYELDIIRKVMRKMSPPAWEFCETCPPYGEDKEPDSAAPTPEYTSKTYLRCYYRNVFTINQLKSLVLQRCHSFLRPETVSALAGGNPKFTSRMDDAFWRIWTFCKIFGGRKGREDDIVGQMDWLRGGPLVHEGGCRATIMSSDLVDASSALMNASDHFARGNPGGLTAEQLYDITELWNCMAVLLSNLDGRFEQARTHGVYDNTDVRGGDIDGEDMMLQEWVYYVTTLGLSAIVDLATASQQPDPSAFVIASQNGWMDWTPPQLDGSRSTFLKESVARIYEEKIAAMVSVSPGRSQEMEELSRQRIAAHKAEIRNRKRCGNYRIVRMSQERPISEWEEVFQNLLNGHQMANPSRMSIALPSVPELPAAEEVDNSNLQGLAYNLQGSRNIQSFHSSSISTSDHSRRASFVASAESIHPALRQSMIHPSLRHDSGHGLSPGRPSFQSGSEVSSEYSFGKPYESEVPRQRVIQQHPRQQEIIYSNPADNTSDRAVFRIVEMGFTPEEAKYALMKTDLGDGLRIDRAVELLLRIQ